MNPYASRWILGGFSFLTAVNDVAVNDVAMNICAHVFMWTCVFFSRGYAARSGIAGSRDMPFSGTTALTFIVTTSFYCLAGSM